ncbi:MAG: SPOR domain-containing protein [Hyphomicrobiaceae bacterium]
MTRSNGPYDQAPHWRRHTRAESEQTGQAQQYAAQQPNRHFAHQNIPNQPVHGPNAYSNQPGPPENYGGEAFHGHAEAPSGYEQTAGGFEDYHHGHGSGVNPGEDLGYYQQAQYDPQGSTSHHPTQSVGTQQAYPGQSGYGDHQALAGQPSYQDHSRFPDHGSNGGQDWHAGYSDAHHRQSDAAADFAPQLPDHWAREAGRTVGTQGYPGAASGGHQLPDATAFDLGNYAPNGSPELASRPSFGEPGYAPGAHWEVGDQGGYVDRGHFQSGHYEHDDYGAVAHPNGTYDDEDDYDDEYEPEISGGRRRLLWFGVVSGTVITALAGMIYAYSVIFPPAPSGTRAPIVEAEALPAKVQPTDPGGKKFDHKESALIDRIGDSGQNQDNRFAGGSSDNDGALRGRASDSANEGVDVGNNLESDANRVRSVSTLVVGRDGRLIAPDDKRSESNPPISSARSTVGTEPEPEDQLTTSVPGLMIVGGPLQGGAPQQSSMNYRELPDSRSTGVSQQEQTAAVERTTSVAAAIPEVQPVAQAQTPAAQPAVQTSQRQTRRSRNLPPLPVRSGIDKSQLAALAGSQTAAPETAAQQSGGPARANVTQVVPPPGGAVQPAAATTSQQAVAGSSGSGFVAVLSSKRTQIEALTTFADLRNKYSNILSDVVPEVKRTDLSNRGLGVVYRAVIGPPSSRQSALRTCTRLKDAGYSGCWVAPY